jgi:hypothetical protein
MMHNLEVGIGMFSLGECACMASANLSTAKIELEETFDSLIQKGVKFPVDEKLTTILETASFARKFLAAVEWYEHVNALADAFTKEENHKKGIPTQ